jgi:cytochrome c oxidase subunit 3
MSGAIYHKFHLVDRSPWPILAAISAAIITLGGVMYMHFFRSGFFFLFMGILSLIVVLAVWWRDVIREATYQGHHTFQVQRGLRIGVVLFIVSEVLFFLAFFWAFFHSSLSPTVEIGSTWPPVGIIAFSPFEVPLLNTIILLSSGATITLAHYFLLLNNRSLDLMSFAGTVGLAILFTLLQAFEYFEAPFSISEGIYGSTFFMATGFHGFHVIIGTIFITVSLFRFMNYHFTASHHFGFEAAAWYWHFVDVVWLFLYICVYFWGNFI